MSNTSSFAAEATVTDAVALSAAAEVNVPRGVVWWTSAKVITPAVAASGAALRVTTTLFVPVAGATNRQISVRPLLSEDACDPTELRLTPL
jgi:hypothetical protein